jgi:hypothetical protein
VIFILVGSTVFSLTFRAVNGDLWVEHLLTGLPGGQIGFLIVVNVLVFLLAFFLDFFELAFIIVPLLAPAADKLGIDLIWFGVLLAVNMQTSFMHPPFGFALFYLRSVAAKSAYLDKTVNRMIQPVTTGQIYWGATPFVVIQLIMVGIVIAFPGLVLGPLQRDDVEPVNVEYSAPQRTYSGGRPDIEMPPPDFLSTPGTGSPQTLDGAAAPTSPEDDRRALEEAQELERLFRR